MDVVKDGGKDGPTRLLSACRWYSRPLLASPRAASSSPCRISDGLISNDLAGDNLVSDEPPLPSASILTGYRQSLMTSPLCRQQRSPVGITAVRHDILLTC